MKTLPSLFSFFLPLPCLRHLSLFGECIPQPLARKAWGRCPAVSMREIYSALAAWHPAGFSVWVVSHSPDPLPRLPTGQWGARLIGWSEKCHCRSFVGLGLNAVVCWLSESILVVVVVHLPRSHAASIASQKSSWNFIAQNLWGS